MQLLSIAFPVFHLTVINRRLMERNHRKNVRAVWKVFAHFQYLENRSRGLCVTWQPVWGDLTVHPWNHSPMALVSRQWDAIDWACALCDHCIHNDQASRSASSWQCTCPFCSSRVGFYGKASHHPVLLAPLQPRFGSLQLLAFPKAKFAIEREEICECDGHTVHKLSQRHLTANWLVPRDSECSWMRSKVSCDWLPSYIKATRPVLEIFEMAGYFPDSPRVCHLRFVCWRFRLWSSGFQHLVHSLVVTTSEKQLLLYLPWR